MWASKRCFSLVVANYALEEIDKYDQALEKTDQEVLNVTEQATEEETVLIELVADDSVIDNVDGLMSFLYREGNNVKYKLGPNTIYIYSSKKEVERVKEDMISIIDGIVEQAYDAEQINVYR